MPRKPSSTLTDAELPLMQILWRKKRATVGEVAEALWHSRRLRLAYTTVLTTLRILEKKGYLRHTQEGRAFVYEPAVNQTQVRNHALQQLLGRFFNNSPELLVLNILADEKISLQDLKRLRQQITSKASEEK